jgi:2-hydroxy-3-keto-5-methylthiopentenyl-1-phosphate phosphatase
MCFHECTASEKVEVLVITPELDITGSVFFRDRDGVISLHDRIEELLERYADSSLIPLREVISIKHLCDREIFRELTDSGEVHSIESFAIVVDFDL